MSDVKKIDIFKHGTDLYQVIPPLPTDEERGGIIASLKTDDYDAEVKIGNDGKLYTPDYATKDYVVQKIMENLIIPPAVTSYVKPETVPIQSGTQLIFYGSTSGTMEIKLGNNKIFSKYLSSMNDVGWVIWIQTNEGEGSFVSLGERSYFNNIDPPELTEVGITWTPDVTTTKPNWIVITIN